MAVGRQPAPRDPGPCAKRSLGWGSCGQCGSPPGSLAPGPPPGLLRARGGPGPEEGGPRQPLPTCLPRSPVPAPARLFHQRGPGLAFSGCPCPEGRGQEGGGATGSCLCPPVVSLKQTWRPSPTPPGPRAPRAPRASSELTERAGLAPLCPPGSPPWEWRGGYSAQLASPPDWHRDQAACPGCGEGRPPPGASWATRRPAGGEAGRSGTRPPLGALRGCACQGPAGKWAGQRAGARTSPTSSRLCVCPSSLAPDSSRGTKVSSVPGGAWLGLRHVIVTR